MIQATRLATATAARSGESSLEAARALDLQIEATVLAAGAASPEVVALAQRTVRLKERHLPATDVDIAVSLQNLASVLTERGQYPQAIEQAQRALTIRRRALPANHSLIADSLDALALPLVLGERYQDAERVVQESLTIRNQTAGQSPLAIARTDYVESVLYRYNGDYARATAAVQRALEIRRRLAPDHPDIVPVLQVRGDLYFLAGDLNAAEGAWQDALSRAERAFGAEHPLIPRLLNGVASVAQQRGDLDGARRATTRALDLAERVLAPCHRQTLIVLGDLGNLFRYTGDYDESRMFYAGALERSERCLGPNHSLTAAATHNAANLAVEMGDFARAEELHRRATNTWSTTLGSEHPYVARGLQALATVMTSRGRPPEAVVLLQRALAIRRKALGPHHPDVAGTLVSLARAESASGRIALASRQAEEAVSIYNRAGRPQEPDYLAEALVLLGDLEAREGRAAQSRVHFAQAAALRSEIFGPEHPLSAEATARVASADFATGSVRPALMSALDAERVGRDHLRFTIRYLPERQALAYAAKRPRGLDLALSVVAGRGDVDLPGVFDAVTRSRGVILDELAARARTAASGEPEVAALMAAVKSSRERFATLMFRSTGGESMARARLDEARQQKETAERALAERSAEARNENSRANVGLDDVRRSLSSDTALVSFIAYDRTMPAPRPQPSRIVPSYMALVMAAGTPTLHAVALGTAADVEAVVARWRQEVDGRSANISSAAAERAYRTAGARLRQRIWDPLTSHFGAATRVFIVPDGVIHLVSFAALPVGSTAYLVEEGPVTHLLSTERDLVTAEQTPRRGRGLLAVGGPSYGADMQVASATRSIEPPCGSLDALRFDDLPGSRDEVQEVARIWAPAGSGTDTRPAADAVTVLSGTDASERQVVRSLVNRRVVHLATHGFFLDSACRPGGPDTRSVGGLTSSTVVSGADRAENPLLFSGLALAGANRGFAAAGGDDGILTAEEVSGLNLQGTEWAVLSACDTGLGRIQAGEGVFGLRRAFQIAGAGTVIMSLWSVSDQATKRWMQLLYEERLQRRADTANAVRSASRRLLAERRSRGESAHPFYWAAFVAAGDWR